LLLDPNSIVAPLQDATAAALLFWKVHRPGRETDDKQLERTQNRRPRKTPGAADLPTYCADWRREQVIGGEAAGFCGVSETRFSVIAETSEPCSEQRFLPFEGCRLGRNFSSMSAAQSR
jgi:hypothetical protein